MHNNMMLRLGSPFPSRATSKRAVIGMGGGVGSVGVGSSSSIIKRRSRREVLHKQCAMIILMAIAGAWILVTVGTICYHFYHGKPLPGLNTAAANNNNKKSSSSTTTTNVVAGGAGAAAGAKKSSSTTITTGSNNLQKQQQQPESQSQRHDTSTSTTSSITDLKQELKLQPNESPLLIFTCKRHDYLRETLQDVLQYIPSDGSMGCPIVISQDGNDAQVQSVISDFTQQMSIQKPNITVQRMEHKSALRKGSNSYQALAIHYGWALKQLFENNNNNKNNNNNYKRVIILEEDLHIAPDFFSYFQATAKLLDTDPTLFAISAYNDNGLVGTVLNATRLLRSDFFPGLGWMMTAKLWKTELSTKWPSGYWDDWLREPPQRQDRQVIRPEISRTYHFGIKGGASHNQFGSALSKIQLNTKVDIAIMHDNNDSNSTTALLATELEPTRYEHAYWNLIMNAKLVTSIKEALEIVKEDQQQQQQHTNQNVRIEYNNQNHFRTLVHQLPIPLMDDEKAGVPRTAYKGVVETRPYGTEQLLFLTPPMEELKQEFSTVILD